MYEPYGKIGLKGYKYDVGDFGFIDIAFSNYFSEFLNIYYYVMTGEHSYGDNKEVDIEITDEVIEEYRSLFEEIILDCIKKLKENINMISKTDNFIIYFCYHDMSDEEDEKSIRKTVDKDLFKKLLNDSYVK